MSKTIFSDSTPDSAEKIRADSECQRANQNALELSIMKARIRMFNQRVETVRFNVDEQQAEPWMANWFDYLLQGAINSVVVNDGDADVVKIDPAPVAEFETPDAAVDLVNTDTGAGDLAVPAAADFERDAEDDKFDTDSDNIDIA